MLQTMSKIFVQQQLEYDISSRKYVCFLFRSHSTKKNEIERKCMWMWFLKSLFNIKHHNKTFYERIFRIFHFSRNACMYCFCYLFYSKKTQNRTNAYIIFFVDKNLKLFKRSSFYLHNLIYSLTLSLEFAFKLLFHVFFKFITFFNRNYYFFTRFIWQKKKKKNFTWIAERRDELSMRSSCSVWSRFRSISSTRSVSNYMISWKRPRAL
jgi:hypothetical protein